MTVYIMDSISWNSNIDLKFKELIIIHEEEKKLSNALTSAISEMFYFKTSYKERLKTLLNEGTPEFESYKDEINSRDENNSFDKNTTIELMDTILSAYFKSTLVFAVSILDKLVKLYNFRYDGKGDTFRSSGKHLIIEIEKKNYKRQNKNEVVNLIKEHQEIWINTLVKLRNEFAHKSELAEYHHFSISPLLKNEKISSFSDLNVPYILVKNKKFNAGEYLDFVFDHLIIFLNDFLKLCGFNEYYKCEPSLPIVCDICKSKLVEEFKENGIKCFKINNIKIIETNKRFRHGIIICNNPKCGAGLECSLDLFYKIGFLKI